MGTITCFDARESLFWKVTKGILDEGYNTLLLLSTHNKIQLMLSNIVCDCHTQNGQINETILIRVANRTNKEISLH